jgi:hypothetical protein
MMICDDVLAYVCMLINYEDYVCWDDVMIHDIICVDDVW